MPLCLLTALVVVDPSPDFTDPAAYENVEKDREATALLPTLYPSGFVRPIAAGARSFPRYQTTSRRAVWCRRLPQGAAGWR